MSNKSNLELQIEKELEDLKQILSKYPFPEKLDARLVQLGTIMENNPTCFITLAASCLKIRSENDDRLAKVDVDFKKGLPKDIGERFILGLRNRDIAYLFLLALHANEMWDKVKFHYRGSSPRSKELSAISKIKNDLTMLTIDGPIEVRIGESSWNIDGVSDVPNVPKADFVFTLNGNPQIFVSHKHFNTKTTLVNSFRQYSGVSKFCLGDLASSSEITELVAEIKEVLCKANVSMTDLRKGSYFAKKIRSTDLICAAMFGRDYETKISGIHNVDIILQGDISFKQREGYFDIIAPHVIPNPKHINEHLQFGEEFDPHFMIMKSSHCNQFFSNVRIAIWPKNAATQKGLKNYESFFLGGNYDEFK